MAKDENDSSTIDWVGMMANELDHAQDVEQRLMDLKINAARKAGSTLRYTAECHWCSEPVEMPRLFCNGYCASEHHKHGAK